MHLPIRKYCCKYTVPWQRALPLLVLLIYFLSGCANHPYYAEVENGLDTSGYYDKLDHIASYYPRGVSLNFPGYIVAIEETPRRLVTNGRKDIVINEDVFNAGYTVERLIRTLRFRVPFISQIMRYEGRPYGEGNCALYSPYHNKGTAIVKPCNGDLRSEPLKNNSYQSVFSNSWDAIDVLKEYLSRDLKTEKYTHLIVAVMGLDTAQEEAIRNYNSIISSIRLEAGKSFRPLFIGITWPSYFANRWFDPLWEILAYHPVADRADIIGLSWLGVLLDEVVMPLSENINVSIVAHSFGARAASMGVCVGPGILRDKENRIKHKNNWKITNFVGLAPAFSLTRFINGDFLFYENIYYKNYCPMIKRFVFTASRNDHAFGPLFWTDAVGDYDEMADYCNKNHLITVSCISATSDGRVNTYNASSKITYIDTSLLMKYTMPGTKGGGHSDIFRPEIGRFLWAVINDR